MHNVRTALEYNINEKNHLNVAYTGSFTPDGHNRSIADGSFQQSSLDKFTDNKMNNITVLYSSGIGLEVGAITHATHQTITRPCSPNYLIKTKVHTH